MSKNIHNNSRRSFRDNEASGRGESYRNQIRETLRRSRRPMTDREIMDDLDVEDCNNIRPEITRLKQAGEIVEATKTTCQKTGKKVRRVRLANFSETFGFMEV